MTRPSFSRLFATFAACGLALLVHSKQTQGSMLPPDSPVLALAADTGVTTSAGIVTGWADEVSSTQRVASTSGSPALTTGVVFPNGTTHNVISFAARRAMMAWRSMMPRR